MSLLILKSRRCAYPKNLEQATERCNSNIPKLAILLEVEVSDSKL